MFLMVTIASVCSLFLATGHGALGACLLATSVSARVAVVDFSLVGAIANAFVLVFGIPMLMFAVLCAMK